MTREIGHVLLEASAFAFLGDWFKYNHQVLVIVSQNSELATKKCYVNIRGM